MTRQTWPPREDRTVTESSGNVYLDLGFADAKAMLRKARFVANIQEIIEQNGWSQKEAARRIGLSQERLANMLQGKFNCISEVKILGCLTKLGSDVKIIVTPSINPGDYPPGNITVHFA